MFCEDLCDTELNIIQLLGHFLATPPTGSYLCKDLQVTGTLYTTWGYSGLLVE